MYHVHGWKRNVAILGAGLALTGTLQEGSALSMRAEDGIHSGPSATAAYESAASTSKLSTTAQKIARVSLNCSGLRHPSAVPLPRNNIKNYELAYLDDFISDPFKKPIWHDGYKEKVNDANDRSKRTRLADGAYNIWKKLSGPDQAYKTSFWGLDRTYWQNSCIRLVSKWDAKRQEMVSGGISGSNLYQKYGWFRTAFRMDVSTKSKFAVMLYGDGKWPYSVEIDIVEAQGGGKVFNAYVHFGKSSKIRVAYQHKLPKGISFAKWNEIGIRWTPTTMTPLIDNKPVARLSSISRKGWTKVDPAAIPKNLHRFVIQTEANKAGREPDKSGFIDWVAIYRYVPGYHVAKKAATGLAKRLTPPKLTKGDVAKIS